jgi:hypothetical protein
MLSDEDAELAYNQLAESLQANRLSWVVQQVDDEIRFGKTEERELETFKEVPSEQLVMGYFPESRQLRRGPKAKFAIVRQFTSQEKLKLLTHAIERAVVDTAEMELYVSKLFSSPMTAPAEDISEEAIERSARAANEMVVAESVRLVHAEQADEIGQITELRASESALRSSAAADLRRVLRELLKEI